MVIFWDFLLHERILIDFFFENIFRKMAKIDPENSLGGKLEFQ
jgi:hypothetical protein